MNPIAEMVQGPVGWLRNQGPEGDRILSTRIRLARNVVGTRFCGRAIDAELAALGDQIEHSSLLLPEFAEGSAVQISKLPILDRQFLLERHLISHDLTAEVGSRGLVWARDESRSVMINEEDHVRIQVLMPGFQVETAYAAAREVDEKLRVNLPFAYDESLGYLTACPTNVGTGLRASVLIHLPALVLTQRIKKILKGVTQVGLTVRGFYGEGTEVMGNFFQVSNQVTLGETEAETLKKLDRVVRQILDWEKKAENTLLSDAELQIEDKILRALGTLKYSRLLGSGEVIGLLSAARFGSTLGMKNVPPVPVLNDVLLRCQPAHLQRLAGREMVAEERNAFRAEWIQKNLGVSDVPRREV